MNKDYSIQIIRCISLLMIISCHILQGLENRWAFWINVGVQIFFFVSGFLYGNKNISSILTFYKNRVKRVLVPLSLLVIIIWIVETIFLNKQYSISFVISNVLGFGGFNGTLLSISNTWFVSYILICYMITPMLQAVFNSKQFKLNLKRFIVLILFLQLLQLYEVTNINMALIVNYVLGYFYSRCCKEHKKGFVFTVSIMSVIIIPMAIILQENLDIRLPYIFINYKDYIINYGHVLLGTLSFLLMYRLFSRIKIKTNKLLNLSDKYSYYIYLVHQIFILNSFSVLKISGRLYINIILIMILSIAGALVLYYFEKVILIMVHKVSLKHNIF